MSWTVFFPSSHCIFIDLINGFVHFLFKVLEHLFNSYLKSLSYVSSILCFSEPEGCWVLMEVYWLILIVFLGWCLGIWFWDVCDTDIWSYLCWVGFLFLCFCCLLWILAECCGYGLHDTESFWIPDRSSHWGSQVELDHISRVVGWHKGMGMD